MATYQKRSKHKMSWWAFKFQDFLLCCYTGFKQEVMPCAWQHIRNVANTRVLCLDEFSNSRIFCCAAYTGFKQVMPCAWQHIRNVANTRVLCLDEFSNSRIFCCAAYTGFKQEVMPCAWQRIRNVANTRCLDEFSNSRIFCCATYTGFKQEVMHCAWRRIRNVANKHSIFLKRTDSWLRSSQVSLVSSNIVLYNVAKTQKCIVCLSSFKLDISLLAKANIPLPNEYCFLLKSFTWKIIDACIVERILTQAKIK